MVWLCKTKIWWKFKNLLHGCRQLIIVHVKRYAEDIQTRFGTSNIELNRPLSKRKNKEVIGLMNDELNGHIMKGLVRLRAKAYSYLKDNNDQDKKNKRHRRVCH